MSSPNSSTSPTTYSGSCHCNQISYTVTLPAALAPQGTEEINSCNCSICTKNGYLLVYPLRSDVQFLNHSDEKLKSYYFGQKEKPHKFCPECGSSVLIDFGASPHEKERQFLAMNARLFQDIDLEKAVFTTFDGKNKLPASEAQQRASKTAPSVKTI